MYFNHMDMKQFAWRKCRKIFLKAFFLIRKDIFSKFSHKIVVIILRDITGLENFILSFSKS